MRMLLSCQERVQAFTRLELLVKIVRVDRVHSRDRGNIDAKVRWGFQNFVC